MGLKKSSKMSKIQNNNSSYSKLKISNKGNYNKISGNSNDSDIKNFSMNKSRKTSIDNEEQIRNFSIQENKQNHGKNSNILKFSPKLDDLILMNNNSNCRVLSDFDRYLKEKNIKPRSNEKNQTNTNFVQKSLPKNQSCNNNNNNKNNDNCNTNRNNNRKTSISKLVKISNKELFFLNDEKLLREPRVILNDIGLQVKVLNCDNISLNRHKLQHNKISFINKNCIQVRKRKISQNNGHYAIVRLKRLKLDQLMMNELKQNNQSNTINNENKTSSTSSSSSNTKNTKRYVNNLTTNNYKSINFDIDTSVSSSVSFYSIKTFSNQNKTENQDTLIRNNNKKRHPADNYNKNNSNSNERLENLIEDRKFQIIS